MSARILATAADARKACGDARAQGLVAFVPTMGALHDGHLALVREGALRAAFVVVSIFVNPTQFGPGEDFTRYPRDLDGDVRKVEGAGASLVFAPPPTEMYPPGDATRVRVGAVAEPLEGAHRPGHFEGVATVVAKLFGIVGPCVAVFGQKDYQQLAVVRRVVRDMFLPVEIAAHPIVREPDGLAMSSRNAYLSPLERQDAVALSRGLDAAERLFASGERGREAIERAAREPLERVAASIDYVAARDPETLAIPAGDRVGDRVVVLIACRIGATRLIDNRVLG